MRLPNTPCHVYLLDVNRYDLIKELGNVDRRSWSQVREARWHQLKNAEADYPVQQELQDATVQGWSENRAHFAKYVQPYFDRHDELTIQDELIFKGQLLGIPTVMRKELMEKTCATHIKACTQ